eukprot:TRINITY_DN1495_c0_g1_i1.p1 TRINITY_DN1495_c0_g1~~TRINITY_DN1495_c0_g1_i1.p1  ORF type:complete len:973 (+),score=228.50 TRINITY_DN1495_c0_g1_i1:371-3289(+)
MHACNSQVFLCHSVSQLPLNFAGSINQGLCPIRYKRPRNSRQCYRLLHRENYSTIVPGLLMSRRERLTKGKLVISVNAVSDSGQCPGQSMDNSEDFISRVLRTNPAELEIFDVKDGNLYTRPVKRSDRSSVSRPTGEGDKTKGVLDQVINKFRHIVKKVPRQETDAVIKTESKREDAKPVYLEDLLRQHRGQLYVPEEAFKFRVPDTDEFNTNFESLTQMSKEEFLKAAKKNQIKMLTSRTVLSLDRVPKYHNFIVEFKDPTKEKRAMSLTTEEAGVVLKEYSGPQREIEKLTSTAYVTIPSAVPDVAASALSSRVLLEISVLMTYAFYAMGGILLVPLYGGIILVATVVFPLLAPLFQTTGVLFQQFARTSVAVIVKITSDAIYLLLKIVSSESVKSVVSSLFYISFVFIGMGTLIKFTVVRRPTDFLDWDIWQSIEFSQSKPQARVEGTTGVKFEDVAGIGEVVEELRDLVTYLKNPGVYHQMGSKPPHGVLLEGPPGCGKTLLAKAIAGEAGVPFYQMAGSEFDELIVGVGAARVRDLFKRAQANKPAVVFIDEIDGLGMRRNDYEFGGNAGFGLERETTLNQLLTELDGFDTGKGVIFLGATNRMDLLDPALLRPGRFDRKVTIGLPDVQGCLEILKVHAKKVKLSPSVDLSFYAKMVTGWTGAQIEQLLQEAALMALRKRHKSILRSDMERAINRLTYGPEHPEVVVSPFLSRKAASEVGIALTSHLLRRLENALVEPCVSVSIVPTGTTLTRTTFELLDNEDAYNLETRPQLFHRLQVLLGGRAAEEVIYGRDTSTCSLRHLPDAAWLARKMISIWNLEGPLTVHGESAPWKCVPDIGGPVLTYEGSLYDDYLFYGKTLNHSLDSDIAVRTEKLLADAYHRTVKMLENHHAALAKSIYVINETWELRGEDLDLILDLYPASTPVHLIEEEENPGSLPSRDIRHDRPLQNVGQSDRSWKESVLNRSL